MSFKLIKQCKLCATPSIEVMDFGLIPLQTVNNSDSTPNKSPTDELFAPLHLDSCPSCNHLQLREQVDNAILYQRFNYSNGRTFGLNNYLEEIATEACSKYLNSSGFVVDLASDDGTFLATIKRLSKSRILGVEPSEKLAAFANDCGIPTINAFFCEELVDDVIKDFGRANFVFIPNTLANIPDLAQWLSSLQRLIADNGVLWIETQDGDAVIDRILIDTIYHEHIHYFRESSIIPYIQDFGFSHLNTKKTNQKGGSMSLIFKKTRASNRYQHRGKLSSPSFLSRVKAFVDISITNKRQVQEIIASESEVCGFGASVGTHTLISHYELQSKLRVIFDDRPQTEKLLTTFGTVPCRNADLIREDNFGCSTMFIFAYRYWNVIKQRHQITFRSNNIKIVKPLPLVEVIVP